MLCVVCGVFGVRCLFCVARCLSLAVCSVLCVVICWLCVVCNMLVVVCCLVRDCCWLLIGVRLLVSCGLFVLGRCSFFCWLLCVVY